MTVTKHGVSSETQNRLLIGPGAVYWGWTDVDTPGTLLGATRGGNVFEINRTIRRTDPDGAKGPVQGFRRIEEVLATLTINLIEITETNLELALSGASAASHVITGGEIADGNYLNNLVIVGTISDPDFPGTTKPIILKLKNALQDGPVSFPLNPKDEESVLVLKYTAHYDPSDLDTEPWEITYPS